MNYMFFPVCKPKALKRHRSQIHNSNNSIRDEFLFLGESVSEEIRKVCSNGHLGTDIIAEATYTYKVAKSYEVELLVYKNGL